MVDYTPHHLDTLKEMVNIGVGRGADVLNTMLNSHVTLNVPNLQIVPAHQLAQYSGYEPTKELAAVSLKYSGAFSGASKLVFDMESAHKLVIALTDEEDLPEENLNALQAGTLCEVGNIVVNAVMGSISNMLEIHFDYTVPDYTSATCEEIFREQSEETTVVVLANTFFDIEHLSINGNILLFLSIDSFAKIIKEINRLMDDI